MKTNNEKTSDMPLSIDQNGQVMFSFPDTPEKCVPPNVADEYDPVSHPKHYTSGKYEVIDIIEDQLGLDGLRGFALGNALKYIMRAKKKDPTKESEDLEKAIWYLNHWLEKISDG